MKAENKGKLHFKGQTINVSDKFQKRDAVIYVEGKYPQYIQIQLQNKKCELLDHFVIGSNVSCQVNITGFKWEKNGKTSYFNTLVCWSMEYNTTGTQQTEYNTAPF